jgi:hypothetical protein
VDFSTERGDEVKWMRLEVFIRGACADEPYAMVAVYENNENYSRFDDYKLSRKERLE